MSESFDEAYKKLNPAQREAVDAIEGPVMVIAGPGTGKTQILSLRIANILQKTDTAPENILALTFTESGVLNMRKRLASMIGSRAYQIAIHTFHGFAESVIINYPESFPRIIGSRVITEADQVAIIENIIDEESTSGGIELLRPYGDPHLYARDIVSSISELKREGISAPEFENLLEKEENAFRNIPDLYHEKGAHKGKMKGDYQKLERMIAKNRELSIIYRAYNDELQKQKSYDFSDMIMEVLEALREKPDLLQILQENHQYILVDEHQDTNNAQNKILELLCNFHDNPNLFVVGDEKQAIFRFQGASLENFFYFRDLYPEAKLVTLTENYRSTQTLLDSAGSLLASREPLVARALHSEDPIKLFAFESPESEVYFLATDIKERIESGTKPEEIAILYRNNSDAFPIAKMLSLLGVPYTIESDEDLFSDRDVLKLLAVLRAIHNFGSDEMLSKMLHVDLFEISPLDIYRLIRRAHDKREGTLYDIFSDKKELEKLSLENPEAILSTYTKLSLWVTMHHNTELLVLVENVIRESGLLESILSAPDARTRFFAITTLFDEIKTLVAKRPEATLDDFFVYLDTVKKHSLFIKKKKQMGGVGKVRLMTAHRSKGLEFEYVYIAHAYSGHFGDKRTIDRMKLIPSIYLLSDKKPEVAELDDNNADERRLFYVALTRAKKNVFISYAKYSSDGREQLPSSFVDEIKPEFIELVDTESFEKKWNDARDIIFRGVSVESAHNIFDKEFVADLFKIHGLSPTALNNYLDCPWKYFYQNLIRIPSAPTKHQAYGIAVHSALQDFFKMIKEENIGKDFLLESFEGHINRQSLSVRDANELLKKGKTSLSGWYDTYEDSWNINTITEYRINGVLLDEHIRLTGVLDKIEFVDGDIVNVVDYKTGKPKTRNELLGKTKSADGNYYRQLVFYKLLLNNFNEGKLSMQSGVIDFIEPDERGKYHKEIFEITDEEILELSETIRRVADEILNLTFWNKTCSDKKNREENSEGKNKEKKDCEFCTLRKLMN